GLGVAGAEVGRDVDRLPEGAHVAPGQRARPGVRVVLVRVRCRVAVRLQPPECHNQLPDDKGLCPIIPLFNLTPVTCLAAGGSLFNHSTPLRWRAYNRATGADASSAREIRGAAPSGSPEPDRAFPRP